MKPNYLQNYTGINSTHRVLHNPLHDSYRVATIGSKRYCEEIVVQTGSREYCEKFIKTK